MRMSRMGALAAPKYLSLTKYWFALLNTPGMVKYDNSGNLYSVKSNASPGPLNISKLDKTPSVLWQNEYANLKKNVNGRNEFVFDSSGNLYFVGSYTLSSVERPYLMKVDTSGSVVWAKWFDYNPGASQGGAFYSITIDSSDNVYVSGNYAPTRTQWILSKFDSSGTLAWTKLGFDSSSLRDIVYSGGYIYGIILNNNSLTNEDILIKFDTSGAVQWSYSLTNVLYLSNEKRLRSINFYDGKIYCVTEAGGFVVIQDHATTPTFVSGLAFTGVTATQYPRIKQDTSGNFYFGVGHTSNTKFAMAKIDSSYAVTWQREITLNTGAGVVTPEPSFDTDFKSFLVGAGTIGRLPFNGNTTGTYTFSSSPSRFLTYLNPAYSTTSLSYTLTSFTSSPTNYTTVSETSFTPTVTTATNTLYSQPVAS